jgi:hypothetical protein
LAAALVARTARAAPPAQVPAAGGIGAASVFFDVESRAAGASSDHLHRGADAAGRNRSNRTVGVVDAAMACSIRAMA